ncbi:hypothetical protein [Paenibacillus lutimineralis]|uniref:Uncharacterized protein n=1 Tax=Paenibacillus lutimineralis TaxID=2707005 RepID=A0A3Q9IC74_9BACL|nr:hypothetical protein [Paenibacillus lutimineralis]AZS17389.1 hypothetical protein EI981_25190 [Paenibacillus lutimineralis]
MLGVPTITFRREYYMVDLPELLHKKTQQIAEERLANLNIALAPNMKEESFKSLVDNLSWSLKADDHQNESLDRAALGALRQRIEGR